MLSAIGNAWARYEARRHAREAEELRAFAAKVVADCYDPARQRQWQARWEALFTHTNTGAVH